MMAQPRSRRSLATVDFPLAIPPVRPTVSMRLTFWGISDATRRLPGRTIRGADVQPSPCCS